MRRAFAPALVLTIACAPRGAARPEREGSFTEFRDGRCEIVPDCTPAPGSRVNPCNPPPPRQEVTCPEEMLPTQPPGTAVTANDDGTCWVECAADTCDAPGPLRVRCPSEGEAAPTYESALVIPAATTARHDTGVFHRAADLTCSLVECEDGTSCPEPPGRTYDDVPCPSELAPTLAAGIVPVRSSTRHACYFGTVVVTCPDRFHTWH